jgi:predicted Fe-Mo cluster-binding NifX family protein
VEIEDSKILKREEINNPGHQPGYIPQFLKERGFLCIVVGGMGWRVTTLPNEFGIQTIVGINNSIANVIGKLSKGELKSGKSICQPGSGKGHGVEKDECDHGHEHSG